MARWVLLAAVTWLLPLDAFAELSDSERQADAAFQRGMRLYNAEDYMAAADEFERAFGIVPIQSVHYNIARSYELAEMRELAAQHYRAFIDARAGNPERRQEVRQRLSSLSQGLSWISVATEPDGAILYVDGERRGPSPATLAVTPGNHRVEARLDDAHASRNVDVGSEEVAITLRLSGVSGEQPTSTGPGDEPETFGTTYSGQQTTEGQPPITGDPERRSVRRLHHGAFWAGLALTVGSAIALAVVGTRLLDEKAAHEDLLNNPVGPEDPDARQAYLDLVENVRETGHQLEVATTALWVTTGVLALATTFFAIFTDWSSLRRNRDEESTGQRRWRLGGAPGHVSFSLDF